MKPHSPFWLRALPSQRSLQRWSDQVSEQIGNWNPQLLREIKGSCTPRNLIAATLGSLITQGIFWVYWQSIAAETAKVPSDPKDITRFYCTGPIDGSDRTCEFLSSASFAVNWPLWWLDLFFWLSALLLTLLILAGTQALINNWAQEAKQGTLAFIRMTPESSDRILLGKLLGAPALIHWGLLLALPLHTLAGLQGGLGLGGLLLIDGVAVALMATIYLLALFYASTTPARQGVSGWAFGLLGLFFYTPMLGLARVPMLALTSSERGAPLSWFGQNVIAQPEILAAMAIAAFGGLAMALWQSITRRFDNPGSTFSTKPQSYWLTFGFNLLSLGFFVPWAPAQIEPWGLVGLLWLIGMMSWIALLLPPRQTLLDWARYRHLQKTQDQRSGRSALGDWLWGENSPPFLALLVNGAITIVMWLPWASSLTEKSHSGLLTLLALGCTTALVVFYAALAQWALLWQVRKPVAWSTGLVSLVMMGSIMLSVALGIQHLSDNFWGWFWLTTPMAAILLSLTPNMSIPISLGSAGLAFAIDGVAAIAMFFVTMNQLDRLGLSESAALMRGDRLDP